MCAAAPLSSSLSEWSESELLCHTIYGPYTKKSKETIEASKRETNVELSLSSLYWHHLGVVNWLGITETSIACHALFLSDVA